MRAPSHSPKANLAPSLETEGWKGIDGTWSQLYGGLGDKGLSIEWNDFSNARDLDWSEHFHAPSLGICLNFSGLGELIQRRAIHPLESEQIASYTTNDRALGGRRLSGHLHRFFAFEFSAEFLRTALVDRMDGLRPEIAEFLENPEKSPPAIQIDSMPAALLGCRVNLLAPPVPDIARDLWYQGKTTEILSHVLFRTGTQPELFCQRHRRLNRERCERVLFLLERDMENPPSLEMLAAEVHCSTFYLSRIFVQETGQSIPRYLRHKRMEKAAALLRGGRRSVLEAAMAVGYSSLSAFNRAFVDCFACSPGIYSSACHPEGSLEDKGGHADRNSGQVRPARLH